MKWMIATMLVGSTAVGGAAIETEGMGSGTPNISITIASDAIYGDIFPTFEEYQKIKQAEHEAQVRAHKLALQRIREQKMKNVINLVLNQVGKTPYMFSGSTPKGWDCSGLVVWMYSQLDIDLPHSASAQLYVGHPTSHPVPGDIVVWGGGYHSGIYLGNGKTVNALNPYMDTAITDVDYLSGSVTYIHVY